MKNYLRDKLHPWQYEQLKRTNYRCELTGENGYLNVHHMYSFSNIFYDTIKELDIDIKNKPNIADYSNEELQFITKVFLENNERYANPIVMLESIHLDFHFSKSGRFPHFSFIFKFSFVKGSAYNRTSVYLLRRKSD